MDEITLAGGLDEGLGLERFGLERLDLKAPVFTASGFVAGLVGNGAILVNAGQLHWH